MMKTILATLLLAILATLTLHAQPPSDISATAGTTYVIAYPDTTMNTFDARYPNMRHPDKAYMFIYSAVDNRVQIRGAGYNKTELLPAGRFTIVDLMDPAARAGQPIVTQSNVVNQSTFRLEGDQPILVYCYLLTRFGTEAWTPLPVASWGREYFVAAHPGEIASDVSPGGEFDYNKKAKMAPSEITIVAAYDDTRVTIQPTGRLLDSARIFDVVLNANEVYQVQSFVDTSIHADRQVDLGGSRVTATKPIGVISGNTRAQLLYGEALGGNVFKNMLIEWLSPIEHHGTEFVYMPTWDARRVTGAPGEDVSGKRKGELVRVYSTQPGATKGYSLDSSTRTDFTLVAPGRFREDFIATPRARYYKTDKPAQVMMTSTAIIKYNGTTQGFGGYIGAQYDGYGAYMSELVPRERWGSFSPYYASALPAGMEHFINVVTDSAHQFDVYQENGARFRFNGGPIPGTDLVWGTMSVVTARDHYLEGRNGARFTGHVYGIYKGHEEYRPGGARKQEDADLQSAHSGGRDDGEILHPSEYEEYLAVAYGYPLASRHVIIAPGDSLSIETSMGCTDLTINVRTVNSNPSGLQSVRLDSSVNARFVSITPQLVTGATAATIVLAPINPNRDASAILVIQDRTGKLTRVPYNYIAGTLTVDSPGLTRDFGGVNPGTPVVKTISFTNQLDRAIMVRDIDLVDSTQGFSIVSSTPATFPATLGAGQTLTVTIRAMPTREGRTFVDSLRVTLECATMIATLRVRSFAPRIQADDIDFGQVDIEALQGVTRQMKICNVGSGTVEFTQGAGGEFITWVNRQRFTVAAAEIEKLRTARLDSGKCLSISVTFIPSTEGRFVDTARFFANTPLLKSYSIWRAQVGQTVGVSGEESIAGSVTIRPNPVTGTTTIGFHMDHPGMARLVIVDAAGREVGAVERTFAAGDQSLLWDASAVAAGVYFYRLTMGERVASGSVVVVR